MGDLSLVWLLAILCLIGVALVARLTIGTMAPVVPC